MTAKLKRKRGPNKKRSTPKHRSKPETAGTRARRLGRSAAGKLSLGWRKLAQDRLGRLIERQELPDDLSACIKTIHLTVLRLGGVEKFPRLIHAALCDQDVTPTTKAEIIQVLTGFWMITAMAFERVQHKRLDQLPDGDLVEEVARLIDHHKKLKGQKDYAGPRGRPRLVRNPGDWHFVGPLLPGTPISYPKHVKPKT